MEGIKKDILIANKLAKMQKEIAALTPADCETLCNNYSAAQENWDEKAAANEEAYGVLEMATVNEQTAQSIFEGAEAEYDSVVAGNEECINGCEPLPGGQECYDGCNEEWNIDSAQETVDNAQVELDTAIEELAIAQDAYVITQANLNTAEEALNTAQNAVEDAGCEC